MNTAPYLNNIEKDFVKKLAEIDRYVPSGYDLELDHLYGHNGEVPGWYPYKYNEALGGAFPLEEYGKEPFITDEEADDLSLDVEKIIEYYGCYYVG